MDKISDYEPDAFDRKQAGIKLDTLIGNECIVKEEYDQLKKMVDSTDPENTKLGMTIINNKMRLLATGRMD